MLGEPSSERAGADAFSQARRLWFMAGAAALAYGISLRDAPYPDQAAAKVLMCALLILAAARHTPARERGWLSAALAASAAGDALLALPPACRALPRRAAGSPSSPRTP